LTLDQYPFVHSSDFLEYQFYSEGPKGKIEKRILFEQVSNKPKVYNLAFGDLDPATGKISDIDITDNKDMDKILSTVASSVIAFTINHPGTMVVAQGSTASRTRLYQMRVAANLKDIQLLFRVYGLFNEKWELFVKNKPYKAFLVERI
jgi:hypothetical protein